MSVVQALAAMLSAGADASSRLGAASLAANASNANANAALQGDIYRANTQGAIAHRGIDAQNQQVAAELSLRNRLANNQMGLESGRLGLQRRQLGLDSARFGHERDLSLADYGRGPYAPNTGMDDEFKSQFAAASPQDALAMYAKRMLLGNASNPRMMAGMGGLFNTLLQNQSSVDERAWKEKMAKDPTAIGMALAPVVGGMEGMTPEKMGPAMQQLLSALGIGPKPPAPGAAVPGPDGSVPPIPWSEVQAVNDQFKAEPIIQQLGIFGQDAGGIGQKLLGQESKGVLSDPAALAKVAEYVQFLKRQDPTFGNSRTVGGQQITSEADVLLKAILGGGNIPQSVAEALKKYRDATSKVSNPYSNLPLGAGGF